MAFQGSLTELPLPDIIQLVSVSGKTGMFALTRGGYPQGEIFLRGGQITHASVGELEGEEAIYELAIWPEGDFLFTPGQESSTTSVQKSNTNLLMEAARRIDEWQILSKKIPSTRLVPVFTDNATTTSVSLTPQEWAVICKLDERRSIDEVAASLGQSAFDTAKLLYGLITSGLVDLKENLSGLRTERLAKLPPAEILALAQQVSEEARREAGPGINHQEFDRIFKLTKVEIDAGRGGDAVLDLVRACEKLVSAALGPNRSKAYVDRVTEMLERPSSV
ncbi:MAG: DUF4388 domain-containing protein [Acidobacteriota bacterium]